MTEDEAREKWCPFARTAEVNEGQVVPGTAHNRMYFTNDVIGVDHPNNCIASDCMMWREAIGADSKGRPRPYGYCGLTGER